MPTTVTLTGFKEFEDKLRRMPAVLTKEIDGEVEDAARLWDDLAKQDAPTDVGFLRGQISKKKVKAMDWEVVSAAEYSAFVEWGTKSRVRVPADLQGYASQFLGGGAGQGKAKEMIYAWMKRKGIPPNLWWIVFHSIITKGIHPHPFFFIQVPFVEKQLYTRVKTILETEH